jgi:fumarylpyruvate hydrolase
MPISKTNVTNFVIDPPRVITVPIANSDSLFPVNRVFCVGRNYEAHAVEMGHDPSKEPPFFFMKSADTILQPGEDFPYPSSSKDVHHELELVVAIGKSGKAIAVNDGLKQSTAMLLGSI